MSEPSEEIANAMPAVPPRENPPPGPNYSFYLKMKPLRTLKLAIEVLADPTFNNDGFGMVGVESSGIFAISVTNNSNAIATLWLRDPGMIKFDIYAPMTGKLVLLDLISQGFPRNLDGDDDTVAVFHVQGTDRLCFEFGTTPPTGFCAKIVEIPPVTLFPNFAISNGTSVPVNGMKEMIDYVLQAQGLANKTVSVVWKERFATFEIGSERKWEYDYSNCYDVEQPTRLSEGQIFRGSFNWSYTGLMKKASFLADIFGVHFLTYPKKNIMFQFIMGELGELVFIKKALMVVRDSQQRTHTPRKMMPSD